MQKSEPFAACLSCGCLSCCLIGTVLDQQAELHGSGWSTSEVLGALAEASLLCRKILTGTGEAAETSTGGLADSSTPWCWEGSAFFSTLLHRPKAAPPEARRSTEDLDPCAGGGNAGRYCSVVAEGAVACLAQGHGRRSA